MKCVVIAQLTDRIITHLSKLDSEMKFHITIQFNLVDRSDMLKLSKITLGRIMMLIDSSIIITA